MLSSDLPGNDSRASVISLFVGVAALGVSIADYLRDRPRAAFIAQELADDLAESIQGQWLDEARARGLRETGVLPLTWSATERDVSDDADVLTGLPETGRVVRLRLDGRLEAGFEQAMRQLATEYQRVRSERLVILGEPGAGKSVLAILLTLGLLESRAAGTRVPVLLPASSWDPISESMDEWIVQALATSYYNGQREIPRLLNDRRLLLPVVDGLDEIPESSRRTAVRAINRAIGRDQPVVVTCRSAEYEDVIEGGVPVLRRAPVVEVAPVPVDDVIAYLAEVDWSPETDWTPVFARLRSDPDSPVATALSTPLMVSMARRVYQRLGGDPAELLDDSRLDSRHAVEDRLVERMIEAAYRPEPAASGRPSGKPAWNADKARNWLIFLARYLHQHRERDLAWWQLSQRLLSPWVAPGIGLSWGLFFLLTMVGLVLVQGFDSVAASGMTVGLVVSVTFALLAIVAWFVGSGRAPGRLSFAAAGSLGRLRRGFRTGVALATILFVPVMVTLAIFYVLFSFGFTPIAGDFWTEFLMGGALVGLVGVAMAAHSWLDAPPARSVQASPLGFLQQDRRSALVGAVAAGTILGLALIPALRLGMMIAGISQAVGTGWSGEPQPLDFSRANRTALMIIATVSGSASVLIGLGFGLLVLLTRAWPRFVIARLILAVQGRLPWRLLSFLAFTREQELLRQSGGMYQFRHIRVQEWLATQPHAAVSASSARAARWRPRILLAAAAATVLVVWNVVVGALPEDLSRATLVAGQDTVISPDGSILATTEANSGTTLLWRMDDPSGRPRHETTIHAHSVRLMTFSPDGGTLAIIEDFDSPDRAMQDRDSLSLWDTGTGRLRHRLTFPGQVIPHGTSMVFSPDSGTIAITSELPSTDYQRMVSFWDVASGQPRAWPVSTPASPVTLARFSPDGRTLAAVSAKSGSVWLWDTATGRPRQRLTIEGDPLFGVVSLTFSPDSRTLATIASLDSGDSPAWLWDTTTGSPRYQLVVEGESPYNVDLLKFSQDSRVLVSIGNESDWLWDVATGRNRYPLTVNGKAVFDITELVFSPDGRTLATLNENYSGSGGARLWDMANGRHHGQLVIRPSAQTLSGTLAFSPDGRIAATAAGSMERDPAGVWLFDVATRQAVQYLTGHTDYVSLVWFSRDGRTVFTVSEDGTIRLWDVNADSPRMPLQK
ncbi:hypothetical protein Aple_043770 [Acrocarpospora pleiomorpha]|uniref:NACHT domain-containing protein n=1 Tax=Acrocarpospora pleiomorpha TaxID=90975 RepID=A0A5M3XPA0_9ACTN|nr:NACHT domain-containing protein [Acrocarpospora pleiomorpha]GES21481.1 hypothetical protein Aple_043770 [Acrocarpospora pleiomorpha]